MTKNPLEVETFGTKGGLRPGWILSCGCRMVLNTALRSRVICSFKKMAEAQGSFTEYVKSYTYNQEITESFWDFFNHSWPSTTLNYKNGKSQVSPLAEVSPAVKGEILYTDTLLFSIHGQAIPWKHSHSAHESLCITCRVYMHLVGQEKKLKQSQTHHEHFIVTNI